MAKSQFISYPNRRLQCLISFYLFIVHFLLSYFHYLSGSLVNPEGYPR